MIKEVMIVRNLKRGLQFSNEKMNGNEGIVWKNNKNINSIYLNRKEQYYVNHDINIPRYT